MDNKYYELKINNNSFFFYESSENSQVLIELYTHTKAVKFTAGTYEFNDDGWGIGQGDIIGINFPDHNLTYICEPPKYAYKDSIKYNDYSIAGSYQLNKVNFNRIKKYLGVAAHLTLYQQARFNSFMAAETIKYGAKATMGLDRPKTYERKKDPLEERLRNL